MKKKILNTLLLIVVIICSTLIFTACDPGDYGYGHTHATIYTPRGTAVSVAVFNELSSSDITYLNNLVTQNYPNATKLREPTGKYNCHSYAVHNQNASNIHWIGHSCDSSVGAQIQKYWNDGSYRFWGAGVGGHQSNNTIMGNVPNMTRVYYVNGDHTAIRTSSSMLTSKWGAAGLYVHAPTYCDYNASSLHYYVPN